MNESKRSGTESFAWDRFAFFLFGSFIALPVHSLRHFPFGLSVRWSLGIALVFGACGRAYAARSEKGQDLADWIWNIVVSFAWWL